MSVNLFLKAGCLPMVILALVVTSRTAAQTGYDSLQAGQDAYQRAEEQRNLAIDQQRQAVAVMSVQGVWTYPAYVPAAAYGYVPAPVPYGVYRPRRAYRQALRYGYPPVVQAWPTAVVPVYPHVYPRVQIGYGRGPADSNGYVHPPMHRQMPAPSVPTPAPSRTRSQAPPTSADVPSTTLEPIPTPPGELGP